MKHQVHLKQNLMSYLLEESQFNQDLTIYCKNGTFLCNSVLFVTVFPGMANLFGCLHKEDSLSMTIPDVLVQDFEEFFSSIYQQKSKIKTSPSINYLQKQKILLPIANTPSVAPGPPIKYDYNLESENVKCEVEYDYDEGSGGIDESFNWFKDQEDNMDEDSKGNVVCLNITQPAIAKTATAKTPKKKSKSDDDSDSDWEEDEQGKVVKRRKAGSASKKAKYQAKYQTEASKIRRPYNKRKKEDTIFTKLRFDYTSLSCEVCELEFKTADTMYKHVFNDHGPHLQHQCMHCDMVFEKPHLLQCHIDRKHSERTPCADCGKLLTRKQMATHIKMCHRPQDETSVTCDECGKSYNGKNALKAHMKRTHEGFKTISKMTKSQFAAECDKVCNCGLEFKTLLEKVDHYKIVHLGFSQCPLCQKVVMNKDHDRHICDPNHKKKKSHPTGPAECNICGHIANSHSSLYYHKRTVHEAAEVPCEICGKIFNNSMNLYDHKREFHKDKLACSLCGVKVKNMRMHMLTVHTDNSLLKYKCEYCGKGFPEKQKMDNHMMSMHLKLKPHRCRYGCDIGWNDRSNRNQHEKKTHGALFTDNFE